jgi:glycosyltransferase involved in cell wall biosynthesis
MSKQFDAATSHLKTGISAVVITLNEERNIADCLASVTWADEIVVVDACSTDRTVELARRFTPKVFVRPWPGYGPQKNFGIEQPTADWILIVDADERVSPELQVEIRKIIALPPNDKISAYRVPRRNYYYGRWVRWGGIYPDYQIRLFRKGYARYNDVQIHENLLVKGSVGTLVGHLDHFTERQIEDHFRKFGTYTTLAAQEKLKQIKRVGWSDLLIRPLVITFKTYFIKQGLRDGVHGLILSVFAGMFTFVKYSKAWDLLRRKTEAGG